MSIRQSHFQGLLQFKIGDKICIPNNYEIITRGEMPSRDTQTKNNTNPVKKISTSSPTDQKKHHEHLN